MLKMEKNKLHHPAMMKDGEHTSWVPQSMQCESQKESGRKGCFIPYWMFLIAAGCLAIALIGLVFTSTSLVLKQSNAPETTLSESDYQPPQKCGKYE
jgi:hypothetical protein